MIKHEVPACYFPSTVLLVDNNTDYLLNFTLQLHEHTLHTLYDSPGQALTAILSADSIVQRQQQRVLQSRQYADMPASQTCLNLLHTEIYNAQRFNEASVVILDEGLDGIDVLDFCETLGSHPIQRIILTQDVTDRRFVNAMQQDIIQCCIPKTAGGLTQSINHSIASLQMKYFCDVSRLLLEKTNLQLLKQYEFCKEFSTFVARYNIIEYYLVTESEMFLLLDADGNTFWFPHQNQQWQGHLTDVLPYNAYCNKQPSFIGFRDVEEIIGEIH